MLVEVHVILVEGPFYVSLLFAGLLAEAGRPVRSVLDHFGLELTESWHAELFEEIYRVEFLGLVAIRAFDADAL